MTQNILVSSLPWAGLLIAAFVVARLLIWLSGAKWKVNRFRSLHRCQEGSVQSLSFVLTLPFFIMIIMLIVQVSQIMIANALVHYAAFASARAAVVWIPTNVAFHETENRISTDRVVLTEDQDGIKYLIEPVGPKYNKIKQAAVLAMVPIGPSRSLGYTMDAYGEQTAVGLANLYAGLDADSQSNSLISTRLRNKLAYSYANTDVHIEHWHRWGPYPNYREPHMEAPQDWVTWPFYGIGPWNDEYYLNEIGWQDHLETTVTYNIPLLPGPVRLFAPAARDGSGSRTDVNGQTYVFTISATATMVNEGEKALISYWQEEFR